MKLISVCSLNKRDIVTTEMYLHELYIHRMMKLHSYFCYVLKEKSAAQKRKICEINIYNIETDKNYLF